MACTRVVERVCAAVGTLEEAPTRFESSVDVSHGGLLWALPALLANGLLRHSTDLFRLPKGFYGLVHIFLLLAYMALARIKSAERLRYQPAGELGKVLGLDRIPEVRTLREKVKLLAQAEQVDAWSTTLSREWMAEDPQAAGVLYADGHVRVYHGAQTKLPRRYVARQRLCLRGMTDYWVNDAQGRPFFAVSTPFTTGLLDTLRREIVPRLLDEVPGQPTAAQLEADPHLHRFTLVFDREGYSPEFFRDMWQLRIACITYHKFPKGDWPHEVFCAHDVSLPHGHQARLDLAERGVRLRNGFWVREIRKRTQSGHQVSVLSTDYTSPMAAIGGHMFARWSQENFFKYMMQHYNLDRLIDYQTAPVDETVKVVNPAYRSLDSTIRSERGKLSRKLLQFDQMTSTQGMSERRMATFEAKKATLKEEIDLLRQDLESLKVKRKETEKHVTLAALPEEERFRQLAPTSKHFIDTIKMIAYRAETALALVLREKLARPDDARALMREILSADADLIPDEDAQTLTVRLHHLTNPMSDKAASFLAAHLNDSKTTYPGTELRLVYELVSIQNHPDQEV